MTKKLFLSPWFAVLLLFLAGAIAYHNCLGNEMFWDDDDFILKNRYVKDFAYWPLWFQQNMVAGSYFVSNYWRPLLLAVFSTEWHVWQDAVLGWHLVNVLTHITDGVLLYFLLTRLFNGRTFALIVSVLFVAHPVHNEAVVYVNSLGDSLATFFVLSGLLLFARFRQSGKTAYASRNYYFALACFPLAVMAKETGFVLCALLPFMDFIIMQTNRNFLKRLNATLAAVWPLLLMALIYVLLRATVLNFQNSFNFYNEQNEFTSSIWIRLLTFFKAMTQYAGFLFVPYQMRVERQMPWAHSLGEWDVIFGGILVAVMLALAWRSWKTKPWVALGVGWFFIAIVPASNILVPINATLYEHFLYMPMIGIMILVAGWALETARRYKLNQLFLIVLAVYLVAFALLNIARNKDWHTAIGFYEQLVQYAPSYRVVNNLGMEYADKGILDKAEATYLKAIAMDPSNPVAYHNIGGIYRDTGRKDLALASFQKTITLNPDFIFSYQALADLYMERKLWPEYKECVLQVLRIDPTNQLAQKALQWVDQKLNAK